VSRDPDGGTSSVVDELLHVGLDESDRGEDLGGGGGPGEGLHILVPGVPAGERAAADSWRRVAIGALATSEIVFIKELGLGTALGVLLNATIVRALLVPSLMRLLGDRNWWAPRPLARLHQRIGLSESGPATA
jgi:hypothetical protein